MIMAGGTGGHIFPALAVAEHLRALGWRIVWLGSRAGMETTLVAPRGYAMAWISMTGVRGKGVLRLLLLPLQLLVAFWQSARAIFAHRPDVVLGMGGYVSFPGGMMAALFNRPLAIHEQNSVAGLANRVLARLADRVLTGFPGAFAASTAVIWTGNPVRGEIAALAAPDSRYRARSGPLRLTVLGGSLGAQALNEIVPQALALLPAAVRPQVTHQAGARHLAEVEANYRLSGVAATMLAVYRRHGGAIRRIGFDHLPCRRFDDSRTGRRWHCRGARAVPARSRRSSDAQRAFPERTRCGSPHSAARAHAAKARGSAARIHARGAA